MIDKRRRIQQHLGLFTSTSELKILENKISSFQKILLTEFFGFWQCLKTLAVVFSSQKLCFGVDAFFFRFFCQRKKEI